MDYESFVLGYKKLLENGLKHEQILEHAKSTKLYFFHRSDGFEKVLKFFLKSDNKTIDEIIIAFIRNDGEMRNAYEKFRVTNSSPKLKIIDKLFDRTKYVSRHNEQL